ncbi:hypothetical protein [[Ruminococcus] lactaris]|uniref:hypothetical protein n=1 Tax=[Ruminococcus] lactaris TaxID=46228 RepID=UPI00352179D4
MTGGVSTAISVPAAASGIAIAGTGLAISGSALAKMFDVRIQKSEVVKEMVTGRILKRMLIPLSGIKVVLILRKNH